MSLDTASDVISILPDAKHIEIDNLEVVRDRPDDQANVPVPKYITALEWTVKNQVPSILLNSFKSRGILLRDEYRFILARIWEFFGTEGGIESGYVPKPEIELSNAIGPPYNPFKDLHIEHSGEDEVPGVVISGTPGIGKSLFLFVLLARRLLARQTTIYQFKSGEFVLFHATGVYHSELVKKEFLFLPQHTWFLVDSNEQNFIPPPSFVETCNSSSRKIVMAASPRETRFTFYSKHKTFVTLWMEPFSEAEFIAARKLQGRKTPIAEHALEKFFCLYGPNARAAYENAKTPDDYKTDIIKNIDGVDWDGIVKIVRDMGRGYFETEFSHLVFIARRQGKDPKECGSSIKGISIGSSMLNRATCTLASVKHIVYHGDSPEEKERAFYIPAADNQVSFDGWLYEPATDHTVILQVTVKITSHDIKPEGLQSLRSNRVDLVVVSDDQEGKDVNMPLRSADLIDNVYRLEY
ncbi:hypothetical protein ACEPAH_7585 [Sanghuangporus vaninii]